MKFFAETTIIEYNTIQYATIRLATSETERGLPDLTAGHGIVTIYTPAYPLTTEGGHPSDPILKILFKFV